MLDIEPREHLGISGLLTEFYWRLDQAGGVGLSELFTPDATFFLPQRVFKGGDAVERWATERAANTPISSRHCWSNLRATRLGNRRFRAEGNIVISMGATALPARPTSMLIGNFTDIVEEGLDGQWRFAERRAFVIFEWHPSREDPVT